ncbi:MAG: RNA-binding S4 domain-containing protein [Clostridia bacterium]
MRLDKFLKVSRIIKRRSVANEACDSSRVEINGRPAKAGAQLKLNDIIKLKFGDKNFVFRVMNLAENVKKEDADAMYEIVNED